MADASYDNRRFGGVVMACIIRDSACRRRRGGTSWRVTRADGMPLGAVNDENAASRLTLNLHAARLLATGSDASRIAERRIKRDLRRANLSPGVPKLLPGA